MELLKTSLENDWILKDSTPYNIQFINNKPIFIDTPSFIKWEKDEGWDSYRQFCMMFLYPLMLRAYLDLDFRLNLRSNLDGIDSAILYKSLSFNKLFKKGVLSHVVLPYLMERSILKKERDTVAATNRNQIKIRKVMLEHKHIIIRASVKKPPKEPEVMKKWIIVLIAISLKMKF